MILILIALIAIVVLGLVGAKIGDYGFVADVVAPIFTICGFIGLSVYAFLVYDYIAADYKKDIINREYKTDYTQAEVFYASDVIDTIRQLNRKRIELNGDLMRDKEQPK